ncbi:MAG: bifunctional methylenetetrahydrofolate dehydrogenase/methenyltetrahydrofolate cyclohydrolase FolD [Bdellovibrionia bacterium]
MIDLNAKPVLEKLRSQIQNRTERFFKNHHRLPKLVVVLVGEDPASEIYTSKKRQTAQALGFASETLHLPGSTEPKAVEDLIEQLNQDPTVDGILIQRPLPRAFDEAQVLCWISPEKDVDGFHPLNAGKLFLNLPGLRPCTPAGILELLQHYQISPAGKMACVVGRSAIVGKPMAALLLNANATVFHCHSQTPNLKKITREAEILVVAAGKKEFITRDYVRPQAVVIDVGIHRTASGKITGDVLYSEVASQVSAITPVPGGVGPMTIHQLLLNTISAAEVRAEASR